MLIQDFQKPSDEVMGLLLQYIAAKDSYAHQSKIIGILADRLEDEKNEQAPYVRDLADRHGQCSGTDDLLLGKVFHMEQCRETHSYGNGCCEGCRWFFRIAITSSEKWNQLTQENKDRIELENERATYERLKAKFENLKAKYEPETLLVKEKK